MVCRLCPCRRFLSSAFGWDHCVVVGQGWRICDMTLSFSAMLAHVWLNVPWVFGGWASMSKFHWIQYRRNLIGLYLIISWRPLCLRE
jgi:hypothetical protein